MLARDRSVLCQELYPTNGTTVLATDEATRIECWPGPGSAPLNMQVLAQVLATAEGADGGVIQAGTRPESVSDRTLSAIAKSARSLAADASQATGKDPLLVRLAAAERNVGSGSDSKGMMKALCEFVALARDTGGSSRPDVATVAAERSATLAAQLPSWAVEQCLR
jgi:hypothetical protein